MPKKSNKKKKKEKKSQPTKTLEERTQFVEKMKKQFLDLGCFPDIYDATNKFFKILDDYQEDGTPASGKINFQECPFGGRDIWYLISNRANIENAVHFKLKNAPKES